jgi:membrane protein required for colicin V production
MDSGVAINYLDIALIAITLFFAAKGFRKGFFHELVGFIGVIVALALALRALEPFAPVVSNLLNISAGKSAVLVFFFVFSAVLFLLRYAENWVHKHANLKLADALNKAIGGVIGLAKGAIVASLLALLLRLSPFTFIVQQQVEKSAVHRVVEGIAPFIYDQLRAFIPGNKRFVGYLEGLVGKDKREQVDQSLLNLLLDLGSEKADQWLEKPTK